MSIPPIIMDNGTGYIKVGLASQDMPNFIIPNVLGRPMLRYAQTIEDFELRDIMFGDEVTPVRSMLDLSYPMKEGIVQDENEMEILWRYILEKKLGIKSSDFSDCKMLLTESALNPNKNKYQMLKILFENIGMGMVNIEPQAKLSLICEGLVSGMVLDSGDGVSHCIPISQNAILHHNIMRLNVAGRHITDYLTRLLQLKGYAFNSTSDFETIRELKEKFCFCSCNIEGDRKLNRETTYYNSNYKLPDGRNIRISNEKFEAPEILFSPHLIQVEQAGIHEMVYNSINSSPMDCRKELYKNIIISGATTMFSGFTSRIQNEIKKVYRENALKFSENKKIKIDIKIVDSPRRKYSVYIGATVLAKVYSEDNNPYWITKEEFQEVGENIIFKKCQNVIL